MNKINLCDSCMKLVPTCDGDDLLYGQGVGNDNVISCSSYVSFVTKNLTKPVYAAIVNSDLTEGRGPSIVFAVCESRSTAVRVGKKQNTQGGDAYIEECIAVKINGDWLARTKIIQPSTTDLQADEINRKKFIAINKAQSLGLSESDINAIQNGA